MSAPALPTKIVVFGATSTIAQHCQRLLVRHGASICCVARDAARLDDVVADLRVRAQAGQLVAGLQADLLDVSRHAALLDSARAALGGIDGVLIAHGQLPDQKACEQSVDLTLEAIAVNATSVASLLMLAANELEAGRHGVIAVISSVAGDRGRRSNYVYGSSKALVTTMLEGLRHRLSSSGVRVVTIKPGLVATAMTAHMTRSGPLWASPATVARGIVRAMASGSGVVYVPWYWRWIMVVIRSIPQRIFDRLDL